MIIHSVPSARRTGPNGDVYIIEVLDVLRNVPMVIALAVAAICSPIADLVGEEDEHHGAGKANYGNEEFGRPRLQRFVATISGGALDGILVASGLVGKFRVVLTSTDAKAACEIAEGVRRRVESAGFGETGKMSITISLGVACLATDETPRDMLERADQALFRAKNSGRNKWVLHPSA